MKKKDRKPGTLGSLAGGRRQDRKDKDKEKDKGEKLPKRRLAVYLEPDLFKRLNLRKAETDRSLSDLVKEAVEALLARDK